MRSLGVAVETVRELCTWEWGNRFDDDDVEMLNRIYVCSCGVGLSVFLSFSSIFFVLENGRMCYGRFSSYLSVELEIVVHSLVVTTLVQMCLLMTMVLCQWHMLWRISQGVEIPQSPWELDGFISGSFHICYGILVSICAFLLVLVVILWSNLWGSSIVDGIRKWKGQASQTCL